MIFGAAAPARSSSNALESPGLHRDVVFTEYPASTTVGALLDRLYSPLQAQLAQTTRADLASMSRAQPVDLSQEQFLTYVPLHSPPSGFGLLVFVPPWNRLELPLGWAAVLESRGIIFVTMARAGNGQNILMRREPLALLAAENLLASHSIDRERVYVSGFSGGSRVALRLALAYPDLFRGALLIAGSDPIGTLNAPLPREDLMGLFRDSRMVYISGENDSINIDKDAGTALSMQHWCAFNFVRDVAPHVGHDILNRDSLRAALDDLTRHNPVDAAKLDDCRLRIKQELAVKLTRAKSALSEGKAKEARGILKAIDAEFGGLAAPRTLELQEQLH